MFLQDIAEDAERQLVNTFNEPIMLCHFPVNLKSFYMAKVPGNDGLTESIDLLLPTVGEACGGSMSVHNIDELFDGRIYQFTL